MVGADAFLMTLIVLKTAMHLGLVASWFGFESNKLSNPFRVIVGHIAALGELFLRYPSRDEVQARLLDKYASVYGSDRLRVILDCVEIRIPKATHQKMARKNFSTYKKGYTGKFMVGLSPGGHISFCSGVYPGAADDNSIVHNSGFLGLLEFGDVAGLDRGFTCDAAFAAHGAAMINPPFQEEGEKQFAMDAASETHHQAQLRIHVERGIKLIKDWRYLDRVVPVDHFPFVNNIVRALCVLVNFTNMPIGPVELQQFDRLSGLV
jgi:hypothetical protein